jgi:hypothetical protein
MRGTRGIVVRINRTVFGIGLCIYLASFFLIAASGPGPATHPGSRGYSWAWWALVIPWQEIGLWSPTPLLLPAVAVVGLINPIFLIAVVMLVVHYRRCFAVLRIIVLSMFPFCWIPFLFGIHPRQGYARWIIGMVVTLFSNRREQPSASSLLFKPTVPN